MTLRERRKAAGLRQVDVAKKLRVHQTTVSLWDRGEQTPYPRNIRKLARLYGVPEEEIINDVRGEAGPVQ